MIDLNDTVIARTITGVAEEKLRQKFKQKIMDDMENVVDELVQEFFEEFKPQVKTYLEYSPADYVKYLDLIVKTTHRKT